ncbi:hypothetical protein ACROYT_G022654 [Oculina patagonica]
MEDRILHRKLGSIDLEEKRLLRQYRSEKRLLKIKQGQRLGNLSIKRNEANGTHINKGSSSPQSMGTSRQLDFTKFQFTCDKRQSSKSFDMCLECPEAVSDGNTFLTNEEWTQPSNRLPRLPSADGIKTPEPMSPTSKGSCQSPVNRRKATWTHPTALQESVTSVDKASLLREHEARSVFAGDHGNCDKPMFLVTAVPPEKSSGPRVRRQTWSGKPLPTVQQAATFRKRSYSDKDHPSLCSTTETTLNEGENVFVSDLKTVWNRPSGFTKMAFPTAEDAVLRKGLLSLPKYPVRKTNSLNSLKSCQNLPPVLENKNYTSESISNEAGDVTNEEVTSGVCPLPDSGKETATSRQSPVFLSPHRRLRRLRKEGNVSEDPLSNNAPNIPMESSKESSRAGEIGSGAVRKVSINYKTGQNGNEQGQSSNQETSVSKNASLKREKLAVRSKSLSSSLGESFGKEIRKDIPKKKESIISKQKHVLDNNPEKKEKEAAVPIDKSKWMKALKKVFNANLFLSGMAALHKQRELDRLALERKQAALEQLYQELQHCRYLRLPHRDDNEQTHSISWVFDKDEH